MGYVRISPGVYIGDEGATLYVDCVEGCTSMGWEPSTVNQDRFSSLVQDALTDARDGEAPAEVVRHHDVLPPWRGRG